MTVRIAVNASISERRVQVGHPVLRRTRQKLVDLLDVLAEADPKSERIKATIRRPAHVVPNDRQRLGGSDHADVRATPQLLRER